VERKRILVFPCGSEVGLEIYRSLRYSRHFEIIGGSSVDDHGKYVFENYIGNIPYIDDESFEVEIQKIVRTEKIDAIYPAMDSVLTTLSRMQDNLPCKVITAPSRTTKICYSKSLTYEVLRDKIPVPRVYSNLESVDNYPVFMKPDSGYGSRGAIKINSYESGRVHLQQFPNSVIMEFLPGSEYTVDCFTDRDRKLLFAGARKRNRIVNGISVNTDPAKDVQAICYHLASIINENLELRGGWFFQLKESARSNLVLLEIACRLGGSSALYRSLGVNFALLSLFDAFGYDVQHSINDFNISLDRALDHKYLVDIDYDSVYIDFDDCLVIDGKINTKLVAFIFQCHNENKKVVLTTKHQGNIASSLISFRLDRVIGEVIHLNSDQMKYQYIRSDHAIFIDDSFSERKLVHDNLGIPVFAPDAIDCLLK
jgi:hypothetical protein